MKKAMFLVVVIMILAMLALEITRLVIKPGPPKYFEDDEMHFKYGSIGAEVNGFPYLIWRELPNIYKDDIPKGWEDFGFIFEQNSELPVGVSVRRYGVQRVGFNCATCHTSIVTIAGRQELILGAPSGQLDLQAYIEFLLRVSEDDSFSADSVFNSAEDSGRPFNWVNKLLYKYVVFNILETVALNARDRLAWIKNRPEHGPGRTDAGNFWRARWGLHPENDTKVGAVDYPSTWNQRVRQDGWFHWDGNNESLTERNYSAALAGGASDWMLERQSIGRVSDWLLDLPSPAYPVTIDDELADFGSTVYSSEGCGGCHDVDGLYMGQVTSLLELNTDPERTNLFSAQMVEYFGTVGELYSWQFTNYRPTDGYANMPLDGIWARAPYLHNGSVQNLKELLTESNARKTRFYRGCSSFDPDSVGFNCNTGFEFDTQLIGNGNSGHAYGTSLSDEDKTALIEYLKTL